MNLKPKIFLPKSLNFNFLVNIKERKKKKNDK